MSIRDVSRASVCFEFPKVRFSLSKSIALLLAFTCIVPHAYAESKGEESMRKLVFELKITDEGKYKAYRNKIKPLMDELGIVVLKEYRISKVVHSKAIDDEVNMLAMFGFPSDTVKNKFFSSETYQEAKSLFSESTANFEKLIE
ncbi:DUF1330 domain-containing protein [Pseudomonadota bacterium]